MSKQHDLKPTRFLANDYDMKIMTQRCYTKIGNRWLSRDQSCQLSARAHARPAAEAAESVTSAFGTAHYRWHIPLSSPRIMSVDPLIDCGVG